MISSKFHTEHETDYRASLLINLQLDSELGSD